MKLKIPKIPRLRKVQIQTLVNARSLPQFTQMIEGYYHNRCLFCNPMPIYNEIIRQNMTHRMWMNPYPLKHTQLHIIIAPIRHVSVWDYTHHMHAELGELKHWALNHYLGNRKLGGGFLERFGNPEYSAGTILHHHINLIVPDRGGEVRLPLYKTQEDYAEAIARAQVFYKLYKNPHAKLDRDERKLVRDRLV